MDYESVPGCPAGASFDVHISNCLLFVRSEFLLLAMTSILHKFSNSLAAVLSLLEGVHCGCAQCFSSASGRDSAASLDHQAMPCCAKGLKDGGNSSDHHNSHAPVDQRGMGAGKSSPVATGASQPIVPA